MSSIELMSLDSDAHSVSAGLSSHEYETFLIQDQVNKGDVQLHSIDVESNLVESSRYDLSMDQQVHDGKSINFGLLLLSITVLMVIVWLILWFIHRIRRCEYEDPDNVKFVKSIIARNTVGDSNILANSEIQTISFNDTKRIEYMSSSYQTSKSVNTSVNNQSTCTSKGQDNHSSTSTIIDSNTKNASIDFNDRLDKMDIKELGTGVLIDSSAQMQTIDSLIVINDDAAHGQRRHRVITNDNDGHSIKVRLHDHGYNSVSHLDSGSNLINLNNVPINSRDYQQQVPSTATINKFTHRLATIASDSSFTTDTNGSSCSAHSESDDNRNESNQPEQQRHTINDYVTVKTRNSRRPACLTLHVNSKPSKIDDKSVHDKKGCKRRYSIQNVTSIGINEHNNSNTSSISNSNDEERDDDGDGDADDASDESLSESPAFVRTKTRSSRSKSLTFGAPFPAVGILPALGSLQTSLLMPTSSSCFNYLRHSESNSSSSQTIVRRERHESSTQSGGQDEDDTSSLSLASTVTTNSVWTAHGGRNVGVNISGPSVRLIVRQRSLTQSQSHPETIDVSHGSSGSDANLSLTARMSQRMKQLTIGNNKTNNNTNDEQSLKSDYSVTVIEATNLPSCQAEVKFMMRIFKNAMARAPASMSRQGSLDNDSSLNSFSSVSSHVPFFPANNSTQVSLQSALVSTSIGDNQIVGGSTVKFEPALELACDEHEFPLRISLYQVDTRRHARHTIGHCLVAPTDWTCDLVPLSSLTPTPISISSGSNNASPQTMRSAEDQNEPRRDSHDSDSCTSYTSNSTTSSSLNWSRRRSSASQVLSWSAASLANAGAIGISLFGADHTYPKVRCIQTSATNEQHSRQSCLDLHLSYRLYQTIFDAIK